MKKQNGAGVPAHSVSGNGLGANKQRVQAGHDPKTEALVQLCSACMGAFSGRILVSLERQLRIEPYQKPALRKFISDSFAAPPSVKAAVRAFKKASMGRHNEAHSAVNQLAAIARGADQHGVETLKLIITAAKALGLSQDEALSILQKNRLAA